MKNLKKPCSSFQFEARDTHTGISALCILIFSTMVCFTNYSVSQNSLSNNNTIWKTQGNAADTNAFMGTTNSSSLRFRTNNTERMRIGSDGYVGIGIEDPQFPLDVEGDIQLTGDIIFKGYEDLQEPLNRFLMIDNTGKTTTRGMNQMKAVLSWEDCFDIYSDFPYPNDGSSTIVAGTYANWGSRIEGLKSILYTGSDCPAWVGVGTDLPEARLDVRGDVHFSKGLRIGKEGVVNSGLYIENRMGYNNEVLFDELVLIKDHENRKILQLNNDGLLRAREIKVDLEVWPDYVFKKDYNLMPLNELKTFIDKYNHLPNVPSAKEIEADGVNLGEAAKTSMEKIEELTLYLLEINEKVENQDKVLVEQQKLLEQQNETIRLQQTLILELKQLTNKN